MKKSVIATFFRFFLYTLFVAGLVYLIAMEGFQQGTASEYSEYSLTEKLESTLALLSGLLFLIVARMDATLRPATTMLTALCVMMLIREADYFLDARVFDGAWQVLVTLVLATLAIYLWRVRKEVVDSVRVFLEQVSAGIFLSGFLVLFVFSRLFGRESFWQAVMGEGYMRVVKNIAEEGTEIMGYGLIAIAATELFIRTISGNRTQ